MVEKVDGKYLITLDKTKRNGILSFPMEVYIRIELDGLKPIFECADVISSGGRSVYNWDELETFENDYPEIWQEALKELTAYLEKEVSNGGEK